MAKDKYELYRVPIRNQENLLSGTTTGVMLCCKYITNDINAEDLLRLLTIIDVWKNEIRDKIAPIVVIDNMKTEQLIYLYVAIFTYYRTGYEYTAPPKQMPISMLLDKELIDELLPEIYLNKANTVIWSDKAYKLVNDYPIMGPKKKFGWHLSNIRFLIFADMWSRATNQIMTFELYMMLEKKRG